MSSKRKNQAEPVPYEPHDLYRLWWSHTIAYHWQRERGGALLSRADLDRILGVLSRASEILGDMAGERTSFKVREHFWMDLIRQGAAETRDGRSLDLKGINPLVGDPKDRDVFLVGALVSILKPVECRV